MRKYALPAALLGGLTSCSDLPTAPSTQLSPPPSTISRDVSHIAIPGQYIVLFRPGVGAALANAVQVSNNYGGTVDRVYTSAINGAAMHLADDAAAALQNDPRILSVEQDEVFSTTSTTQLGATWGLDRIDQRARPLSGSYVYGANGSGVTVYIIDTGINFSQADFGGRAETGYDAITPGGSATDCEGHGSHVAGTVGSTTYGVAKNVRLVAVRVLDCQGNGSASAVLAGIDWVTTNRDLPAVANMSIGAGVSISVNQAVENSILAGITYTVSAGNSGADACLQSPASAPDAITVGATDASDAFAGFSNFGNCVDVLAPGVGITSWFTGSGSVSLSGTSMSSPHVAGAAALYLQTNLTATPAQVRAALIGNATSGIVTGVPAGTPNLLLYTGFIQGSTAPVANFSSSCIVRTCTFDAGTSTSSSSTPKYQWSFGDATNGTGKTPSHTYATGGTFAVTLTITDPNGSSSKTANVAINRSPSAGISAPANNASFARGATVTFTGTGTDPEDGTLSGASLVWTSSIDGAIGTGASLSTTALSAGTHTITLTAKDAQNASGTATVSVVITANHAPTATIAAPVDSAVFTVGSSVTFSGTGTDFEDGSLTGAALIWTSSLDGALGTGVTLARTTLSAGMHTITLTAKDHLLATGTATISIRINRPPNAIITSPTNNATFVLGSTVSLNGTATDPEDGALSGASLVWSSNLDGVIGSGASVSTSTLSGGTHIITLTVKDAQSAADTATLTIKIDRPPTANIATPANNTSFAPGARVSFSGSASDPEDGALSGSSLVWTSSRDGQIGSGASFSTTNLSVGTHTITLTAKDAQSATSTATRTITIALANQPPVAQFSATCPTLQCTLDASASSDNFGIVKYAWSWGDGRNENRTMPTAKNTWSQQGIYTITLIVSDAAGLADTIAKQVAVPDQPPTATISAPANGSTFVQGVTVAFSGAASDLEDGTLTGAALVWTSSLDGQIGTGVSFSTNALSVGAHVITLTARDGLGVTGTATRTITITAPTNHAPVAGFTLSCSALQCTANAAASTDDVGIVSYTWSWGNGKSKTVSTSTTTTTYSPAGLYTVTLIVTDGGGLSDTLARQIYVGNQPPTAAIAAPLNNGTFAAGSSVGFSGSGSDPEDGVLTGTSLKWTSSRDGVIGTGVSFGISTLSSGTHTITLTARDAQGSASTDTRTITIVSNHPPTATIAGPANNAMLLAGANVRFTGSGIDVEDGALSGASLVWTSNLDGQIGTGTSFLLNNLSAGVHTITLVATDAQLASDSATRTIIINRPPTASITSPSTTLSFVQGASVTFSGSGLDPENGTLTGPSLLWTSNRDGQIGTGTSFTKNNLSVGTHTITLTAKDLAFAVGTATIVVTISAQ